jgi:hypothetical protein
MQLAFGSEKSFKVPNRRLGDVVIYTRRSSLRSEYLRGRSYNCYSAEKS